MNKDRLIEPSIAFVEGDKDIIVSWPLLERNIEMKILLEFIYKND